MSEPVVIFDTVVFVRALTNPHSFWGRLVFEHYQDCRLIVSPQILAEIIEVLKRPELTGRFSALQGINVDSIIEIPKQAEVVMPKGSRKPRAMLKIISLSLRQSLLMPTIW